MLEINLSSYWEERCYGKKSMSICNKKARAAARAFLVIYRFASHVVLDLLYDIGKLLGSECQLGITEEHITLAL